MWHWRPLSSYCGSKEGNRKKKKRKLVSPHHEFCLIHALPNCQTPTCKTNAKLQRPRSTAQNSAQHDVDLGDLDLPHRLAANYQLISSNFRVITSSLTSNFAKVELWDRKYLPISLSHLHCMLATSYHHLKHKTSRTMNHKHAYPYEQLDCWSNQRVRMLQWHSWPASLDANSQPVPDKGFPSWANAAINSLHRATAAFSSAARWGWIWMYQMMQFVWLDLRGFRLSLLDSEHVQVGTFFCLIFLSPAIDCPIFQL